MQLPGDEGAVQDPLKPLEQLEGGSNGRAVLATLRKSSSIVNTPAFKYKSSRLTQIV
jgi:hypothetical protein